MKAQRKPFAKENPLHGEGGFTLGVLLITTLIALLILAAVGGMVSSAAKSSTASFNLVKMEQSSNEILNAMTRQLRVARYITASSNNSMIVFGGDFAGDDIERTQSFYVSNGTLYKDGQPWVEGVTSVTFTYKTYSRAMGGEVVITPGEFEDWNKGIQRIVINLEMSLPSAGIDMNRSYVTSVAMMNALR